MDKLRDLTFKMEESSLNQKQHFVDFENKMKVLVEIPGLMGSQSDAIYSDIGDFVTKMHSFKSESSERLEGRVHREKIRAEKELKRVEKELLEYVKIQEISVQNLGKKVVDLEEEF